MQIHSKQTWTPCRSGSRPGIWSSIQESVRYFIFQIQIILSCLITHSTVKSWKVQTAQNILASTFQKTLNWNYHINEITNKANRTLGFVKRNVKTRNEAVKELAYKTLVRPQVEYASSVWNPHTRQNISKIEMVQRRAARWVKHDYSTHSSVSNMLADLGWRSLKNRRIDSQLVMFYKIVHGYVAIDIPPYFEKPQRYTRHMHPLSFRQIHTKATYYQKA